jgi:methionine biosynthesis protein MetW
MQLRLNVYKKWERSRNESFLSLLEFNSNAKVVDIGCGDGNFTLKVKEKIGCKRIYGMDIYSPSLNRAKNKGITIKKVDLNKRIPFNDNSFDVVVLNQVIEHLFYPIKLLQEIHRILKLNGYALISTENLASWDNVLAITLGYTPFSMNFDNGIKIGNPLSPHEKDNVTYSNPHTRIFTMRGLCDMINMLGFYIENAIGNGHILGKFGEYLNNQRSRFITLKVRKNGVIKYES